MVANLWPEEAHLEECVSTLRFAARVRYLQTDPAVNESADPLLALAKAERQLRELRQELAMRDMLSGRARVGYEDLSDGERGELQGLVLRYLTGVLRARVVSLCHTSHGVRGAQLTHPAAVWLAGGGPSDRRVAAHTHAHKQRQVLPSWRSCPRTA
jgi:hypothetical protein